MDTSDIMKRTMEIRGIIAVDNDNLSNLGAELDLDQLVTETIQKEFKITVPRGHLFQRRQINLRKMRLDGDAESEMFKLLFVLFDLFLYVSTFVCIV